MSENTNQSVPSSRMTEESIITLAVHDYVKQRSNVHEVFNLTEQDDLQKIQDKVLKLKEELAKFK
ncbi:hypothetical protein ACO0SA_002776 [Hanseniaspora valbyensis]